MNPTQNNATAQLETMLDALEQSNATAALDKVLDALEGLAEEFGQLQTNYSGRAMFGASCTGIVTQRAQALQAAAMRLNLLELTDIRTDSMGRDTIVYWPQVQWSAEPAHARKARKHLYWHLQGYGRGNVARLRSLGAIDQWQENAARVLHARAYRMLEALDDHILQAIAAGTLNVSEQVALVADELDAQKTGGKHG